MKQLLTLSLMLIFLDSFGQKALSGTVLLQPNLHEYHFFTTTGANRFEADFRLLQFPTVAFAHLNFRPSGDYTKWQLSGWRFSQIKDANLFKEDSTGLVEPIGGSDMILAGGKIGFSKGWAGWIKNEDLHFYLEGASSLQLQYIEINPRTSQGYPRTVHAAYVQVGPNLVLQRHFQRGFLSLSMLLPILQFSFEVQQYQNPSWTRRQQETNTVGFDLELWRRSGLEIGGGFFIGT